jgi:hypothetical protein
MRDEDGYELCGAFGAHLEENDRTDLDDDWFKRCPECLEAEVL